MTGQQVQAVHDALRIIAGLCDGAQALDGHGFNKLDTNFGHDLAMRGSLSQKQAAYGRKLVVKYGRQVPADLLAIVRERPNGRPKSDPDQGGRRRIRARLILRYVDWARTRARRGSSGK